MTAPQADVDLVPTGPLVVGFTSLTGSPVVDLRGTEPALVVDLSGTESEVALPLRALAPITPKEQLARVRDAVLAGLGLVVLAPVIALLAVAIRLDSPGQVLFSHRRLGRNGKPFYCLKLRTMRTGAAEMFPSMLAANPLLAREFEANFKLKNDPRVTRVGGVLRKLCLDEIPQLWNVLVGEMGLVGPRPIVSAEAPRYGAHLPEVLSLRPGMTGLWQVTRRSDTSYAERVELDLEYVRNRTFFGDIGIILRTLVVAVRGNTGAPR